MKYQPFKKWLLKGLIYGCILLAGLGTILLVNTTSLAHAYPTLQKVAANSIYSSTTMLIPTATPTPTVIVISQPTPFTDPSTIIAILGLLIQTATLLLIIKYVRDTASMAKATRDSADATQKSSEAAERTLLEMKKTREEENAPFVVVYFEYIHSKLTIYLVIENIGKSIAKDVQLNFVPHLQASKFNKIELENNLLLKDGIQSIVPNYKIPIPFDYLMHYFNENRPTEYKVTATYFGSNSQIKQEIEYILDLSQFKYTHFVTEKGLAEIDDTFSNFARDFSRYAFQAESTNQILIGISNAINRGILIT